MSTSECKHSSAQTQTIRKRPVFKDRRPQTRLVCGILEPDHRHEQPQPPESGMTPTHPSEANEDAGRDELMQFRPTTREDGLSDGLDKLMELLGRFGAGCPGNFAVTTPMPILHVRSKGRSYDRSELGTPT